MIIADFVKFSEDGESLKFHFKNGSASMTYFSKEASLKALFDLDLNKRIGRVDYFRIRKEIVFAKNLPIRESIKESAYHHLLYLREYGLLTEKQYEKIKDKMKNNNSIEL